MKVSRRFVVEITANEATSTRLLSELISDKLADAFEVKNIKVIPNVDGRKK